MKPAAPVAIVAAMHEELRALLDAMPDERRVVRGGRAFYAGHLEGREVVAVLSGIGKVAAATTATLAIEAFGAGAVLFTGVAGGVGEGVRVGDVVVADALLQHDMDASPLFPRYEVPLTGRAAFPADAAMSGRLAAAAAAVLADAGELIGREHLAPFGIEAPRLHRGLVASGDRFVSGAAESRALCAALAQAGHLPLAVEMEGAALAQVCHDFGVPFAVLRTISDRADDSAHVDFLAFIREVASRYAAAIVRRFVAATGG
ncbi:5'-methylthioadenosine/adenosylhomocysteine nucleosidase [Caldimonas tepidiphila]|uniref:5'-methylthioadenosine/adenosylhomocysteine nucleosidase n=1 Tax=Caldimonas tepidiphila TaxID=2315841 RepID=UPI000E5B9354|nr:5'-methylthioadenosine/adenosylhomocysteine nucleosidase [Caldimonas tepidiphila]